MTTLQSKAPTFDDVWRTIQELALMSKETDRKFQETDRLIQETSQQMKETDRQVKETSQQMKETDRQVKETSQQMKETDRQVKETSQQMKETDRQVKETSLQMKETDKMIKAMSKQLGAHGNRLGEFVQEMVRPAVVRLFRQRHLPVHQVMANLVACDDNGQFRAEIDLLVINSDTAVAIECKSRLSQDDVNEHLERLAMFKDCFPQYSGFTIFGAVATMVLPQAVGHYAYRKGLFVLAQSGDAVEIRNDDAFNPQQW